MPVEASQPLAPLRRGGGLYAVFPRYAAAAVSFAAIYVLVVWPGELPDDLGYSLLPPMAAAIASIEPLTLALPPPDGPDGRREEDPPMIGCS